MVSVPEAVLLVRGGPEEGTRVTLPRGMTTLGRAPLNNIVIDEAGISRQHTAIRGDQEGYWITALGSRNGTFVNGEKLGTDPQRLRNFDRIELGGTDMPVHWVFMESQATSEMPLPLR